MITINTLKEIGSEAHELLKNTQGNNGRTLRRFLGRQCQHNKIHTTLMNVTGLWPRQIKAIIEAAEHQAVMYEFSNVKRGPVVLNKETGDITVTYDVPYPIEFASVREMRDVVMTIDSICRYGEVFRDTKLNRHILNAAKCPDYEYRNHPCRIVPDVWYVSGQDIRGGGGGVLEWCISESDAQERMALMKKHKRFTNLSIENWAAYEAKAEQQRREAA